MTEHPFSFDCSKGLEVKEFVEKEGDFSRLYVCCDSGESRSTAMAAAIMRHYGASDKSIWENPYYHPNILVYKEQLRAFGIHIGWFRMKYLSLVSKNALKKFMTKSDKNKS